MKKIDEVIKSFEISCGNKNCSECPYDDECYDHHVCECYERQDDALHYLKEYRSDMIQYEADRKNWQDQYAEVVENFKKATAKHLSALKDLKGINDPLTWSELKQMEGMPVWVEGRTMDDKNGDYKFWCIVGKVDKLDTYIHLREHGYHNWKSTYGSWWQAYRKERE